MSIHAERIQATASDSDAAQDRCPVDHAVFSSQNTACPAIHGAPRLAQDAAGVWHARGYEEARAILRSGNTKQSGFKAELLERIPTRMNRPILYQEGKTHQQQRKQTARFFTPKRVSSDYRRLMELLSDQLVDRLKQWQRADLSQLSMTLAVRVAGAVVGLTNSRLPGMDRRLDVFFRDDAMSFGWSPLMLARFLRNQIHIAAFFFLDVKPAIQARRRTPREDVISHLLERGYRDSEILTECVTYGAAGMATTREFISVAAWHLLEQPALRERYLSAPEAERHELLQEILRLEPVVGHLYRRATAAIHLEYNGTPITIPEGALIDVHVSEANVDESVVGAHPLAICPERKLPEHVGSAVMSFGDGAHRCPGAFVAIQETDIFLQRLLALDGLRIERAPSLHWNELVTGYELRNFIVALD